MAGNVHIGDGLDDIRYMRDKGDPGESMRWGVVVSLTVLQPGFSDSGLGFYPDNDPEPVVMAEEEVEKMDLHAAQPGYEDDVA